MDFSKFDEFTKELAAPTSRRGALKTLAATVVGGIFGFGSVSTAEASTDVLTCRPLGRKCKFSWQCCSGFCSHSSGKCSRRPRSGGGGGCQYGCAPGAPCVPGCSSGACQYGCAPGAPCVPGCSSSGGGSGGGGGGSGP